MAVDFPFRLDEGLFLEGPGQMLPWGASMKALKQIGSPEVVNGGSDDLWSSPVLGGLSSIILRRNQGREMFTIVPSTMDRTKTVEEQYQATLDALTARLGKPHIDEPNRGAPDVAWSYDDVMLVLRIRTGTMAVHECQFDMHKRRRP
jgi:hypothetical protein